MWWLQSNNNESLSAFLEERNVELVPLLLSLLKIVDEAAALARGFYEKVDELEHELRTNESQILQLVDQVLSLTNQISSLMEANEHLTFVQIWNLNLKYICQSSVPVKLVLGGTVAYKVYGRYSKSNDSNINSQPTFSLMPNTDPDIETL